MGEGPLRRLWVQRTHAEDLRRMGHVLLAECGVAAGAGRSECDTTATAAAGEDGWPGQTRGGYRARDEHTGGRDRVCPGSIERLAKAIAGLSTSNSTAQEAASRIATAVKSLRAFARLDEAEYQMLDSLFDFEFRQEDGRVKLGMGLPMDDSEV